jgi:hypothetical protein
MEWARTLSRKERKGPDQSLPWTRLRVRDDVKQRFETFYDSIKLVKDAKSLSYVFRENPWNFA